HAEHDAGEGAEGEAEQRGVERVAGVLDEEAGGDATPERLRDGGRAGDDEHRHVEETHGELPGKEHDGGKDRPLPHAPETAGATRRHTLAPRGRPTISAVKWLRIRPTHRANSGAAIMSRVRGRGRSTGTTSTIVPG